MTFVCVPLVVEDLEKVGIILQELAYQSQQIVTPAYYDATLIGRYFRDPESKATLDIMSDTRIYDIGLYMLPGKLPNQIISSLRGGKTNYV